MKLSIHDISMMGQIDSDNVKLRVEYTPEGGSTTIDYGRYNVIQNIYNPNIDTETEFDRIDEYEALQERVEQR